MFCSFESKNIHGHFIRHRNALGEITPVNSELDRNDATFNVANDLSPGTTVVFRSVNFPSHVLRHQDFRIKLHEWNPPLHPPGGHENPEQQLLRADATFIARPGNDDPNALSFESSNFPGHFIRHSNFNLFIAQVSDELSRQDTTFFRREPFVAESFPPLH